MRSVSSISIVLILWLAGLCAAAQFAKMGLVLPELQQLYPEAGAASGFLITLISLVGALFGLIAGILVGQLGPRRVLLAGMMLGCLISAIQSFELSLGFLLATRIVEGASHLAIVVSAPTLIAHYSSDRMRASAMTLWGTFFGVSFALTAWLGIPLAAEHGVHALFLAHAIILVITTVLIVFLVPKGLPMTKDQSPVRDTYALASLFKRHKQAWGSPYIAAPAIGWLFYTITYVALLAILPSQIPADQRTLAAALMPLASIASSMTLGVALLWRFTAIEVVNIGFLAAICFALLFLFEYDKVIICILLFSALGLVQGASFAAIPQLNTAAPNQALANGTLAQGGNIGNLCGTPVLLVLFNYGGNVAMISLVIACYAIAIYTHVLFGRRRALEKAGISAGN